MAFNGKIALLESKMAQCVFGALFPNFQNRPFFTFVIPSKFCHPKIIKIALLATSLPFWQHCQRTERKSERQIAAELPIVAQMRQSGAFYIIKP